MNPEAAKLIGAGLATLGMIGAGIGVGNIFGSFLSGALRNPSAAASQIAYLLILFAILYVLMSRVFAPRIRKIFDEREATIGGAIASAKQVQAEAAAQAAAAKGALAEARSKAQRTALDAKAKVEAETK